MKWPRDGKPGPLGEGVWERLEALPPAEIPERVVEMLPWWTRLRLLFSEWWHA